MEQFTSVVFGLLILSFLWFFIRSLVKAISRINSIEDKHQEILNLLNEIKKEISDLNSK